MNSYFFLRFNLQRLAGFMCDDQLNWLENIVLSKDEIESYRDDCHLKQENEARNLEKRYKVSALKGKKVLFIGDSLTSDRLGYRGIVTKAGEINATNISFSGATSTDMFGSFYVHMVNSKPDIISILIGTNDSLSKAGKNKTKIVSVAEFERNIRGIIEDGVDYGAKVIISTIPFVDECAMKNAPDKDFVLNSNTDIIKYNDVIRRVAKEYGVILADLEKELMNYPDAALHEPDGVHLNFEGQTIMADLWLKSLLREEI